VENLTIKIYNLFPTSFETLGNLLHLTLEIVQYMDDILGALEVWNPVVSLLSFSLIATQLTLLLQDRSILVSKAISKHKKLSHISFGNMHIFNVSPITALANIKKMTFRYCVIDKKIINEIRADAKSIEIEVIN